MAEAATLLLRQESLRAVIEDISSELELRPLLTRIVRHACDLIGADNGTIGLYDPERDVIRTEAAYRMPPDELGSEMPPGVGLAGTVLATKEPLILSRYGEVEHPTLPELSDNSVVGVPIFWREQLIGIFGIGSSASRQSDGTVRSARRFDAQDVETLTLFARHAAIAIANARLFDATQRALAETQLLYETSARMSVARDTKEVIAAYLAQVAVTAPRDGYACTVALYEKARERRTQVCVCGVCTPVGRIDLTEHRVPYTYDALDAPLDAGEIILINDVFADRRVSDALRDLQRESGRPALAMIPLLVRGERIGLVILSSARVQEWPEPLIRRYQITAAQLATAIDSRQQQHLVYERGQQLAILEERHRLARDLHDSVTQLLFSVTLIAQSVAPAWRRDPAEGEQRIERVLSLARAAHTEMRSLLAELRPVQPDAAPLPDHRRRRDLVTALQGHLQTLLGNESGLRIEIDATRYRPQSVAVEDTLLRIAQEAIANVVKHSRAHRLHITLALEEDTVYLRVEDDGIGFDLSHYTSGYGLQTIRERAENTGGSVRFEVRPGEGTTVMVTLPLEDET